MSLVLAAVFGFVYCEFVTTVHRQTSDNAFEVFRELGIHILANFLRTPRIFIVSYFRYEST